MKFKNKVVWVTGASSGIGEALAYQLAEIPGIKLILSARRKTELERVKSSIDEKVQSRVALLPLDLGYAENLHLITQAAINLFGHIDVMIHNGGISQRSLAADTTLEVDRQLMEVNYFGTIAITKYLLPHFIQRNQGHIAVVTSLVGKFGTPYRSGYAASKHALHGFFDSLRAEISQHIKITMICPGFIKTKVSVNALTEDGSKLDKMDEAQAKGMSPATCAVKIIKAINKNKAEVYIGGRETEGVLLKRFFPVLFRKMLRKTKVR